MSTRYLVVDGHSVIFSWPDLRSLHEQNRGAARQTLATQLQLLHDTSLWRVTLILDGTTGTRVAQAKKNPEDMVVAYAHADETADSLIERLVAGSGKAPEILVITADEAEKRTVESLGAFTASPDWLREEMTRQGYDFQLELARVHRGARWK